MTGGSSQLHPGISKNLVRRRQEESCDVYPGVGEEPVPQDLTTVGKLDPGPARKHVNSNSIRGDADGAVVSRECLVSKLLPGQRAADEYTITIIVSKHVVV